MAIATTVTRTTDARRRTHHRAAAPALVLAAIALAACGSSSHVTSPTTTTTTAPATTTTGGGRTTTAVPAGTRCHTSQLKPSFGMVGAGAGQRYVRVILTNTGAACSTVGDVGMQLLGGSGPVPTNVVRDPTTPPTALTVGPGGAVSALLHWGAIPDATEAQNGPCEPTAQQVQITPPNETQPLVTPWTFGPVCEHGTINAGALQAGVPSP